MPVDPVELTKELVRMNTINPPGREESCARHLGALLENAGFRIRYHTYGDARVSLLASIGGDDDSPPLCFTGHIDTVPLGAAPCEGARRWSPARFLNTKCRCPARAAARGGRAPGTPGHGLPPLGSTLI